MQGLSQDCALDQTSLPNVLNSIHAQPQNAMESAITSMLSGSQGMVSKSILDVAQFDLPLGSTISDKIKSKIVAGEYIELSTLLSPSVCEEVFIIGVTGSTLGTHSIKLNPTKPKAIFNINQWTTAMHIF